jgi:hypothetical protein
MFGEGRDVSTFVCLMTDVGIGSVIIINFDYPTSSG